MVSVMKTPCLAMLFVAVRVAAPVAQEFTSPQDVLGTLYQAYMSGGGVDNVSPYFSDRLTEELGDTRISPAVMAAIGVDPLVGATDPEITMFEMEDKGHDGARVVVDVQFHNRHVPVHLTFELIKEDQHGWQIDHLSGSSGTVTWCSGALIEASKRLANR
jgi:hypothetical protein